MLLNNVGLERRLLCTPGRLTSEITIKTVKVSVLAVISHSGPASWGVDLVRQANLTLVDRARGRRFSAKAGEEHNNSHTGPAARAAEPVAHRRAGRRCRVS